MPLARWRETMSLDYPPLDSGHKAFLDVVNSSYMAVQAKDMRAIDNIFKECYLYVQTHISHEEKLMEEMNFPQTKEHIQSHQVFISKVAQMKTAFDTAPTHKDKAQTALHFSNFLSVWLLGHLTTQDKQMKPYLRQLKFKKNRGL